MIDIRPCCPVCGAVIADAELHRRFHDALREIARRVEAPDVSPDDYAQAVNEQWKP